MSIDADFLFKTGEHCVYRTHGVGIIKEIQCITVGDFQSVCYVVFFEKEKLTVSIPTSQVSAGCLRKISTKAGIEEAIDLLRKGVKKTKGMWSRRAKEYEEKINSGNVYSVAEVIRDLTRDIEDADRSYSERIIYETAIYRLASEYAIVYGMDYRRAIDKIVEVSKEKIIFEDMAQIKKAGNR